MEENISERSGFIRLALGVGLTACGTAHLAKESGNRGIGALFLAAGALKVAEGIFLYCPMKAVINTNVKQAVATTFEEYLDGDSIMKAYNEFYTEKWGSGSGSHSAGGSGSNASMQNMAQAASEVAQAVSSATSSGTAANSVSQAAKAAADTLSGNQNSQSQKNNQSNKNQNQNKSHNAKSGQSAQNPS